MTNGPFCATAQELCGQYDIRACRVKHARSATPERMSLRHLLTCMSPSATFEPDLVRDEGDVGGGERGNAMKHLIVDGVCRAAGYPERPEARIASVLATCPRKTAC